MSDKNLSKQRSKYRWQLAYQAMALVAVSALYPATVHALSHPLVADLPVLFRLERWNLPMIRSTTAATAGWLALYLVIMMARSVWRIYGLMGVHLKPSQPSERRSARKSSATPSPGQKRKPTSRG